MKEREPQLPALLLPLPSPEGVEKMIDLYRDQYSMKISGREAFEILSGVMRFIYLTEIMPPMPVVEIIHPRRIRESLKKEDLESMELP